MKISLLFLTIFILSLQAYTMTAQLDVCKKDSLITNLKFLKKFEPGLKNGLKKATTRRGVRCVKPGQVLSAQTPDGEVMGSLEVKKAEVIGFYEISDELAKAENTTIEALQKGLISIYGPEIVKQDLTAIYFNWLP